MILIFATKVVHRSAQKLLKCNRQVSTGYLDVEATYSRKVSLALNELFLPCVKKKKSIMLVMYLNFMLTQANAYARVLSHPIAMQS